MDSLPLIFIIAIRTGDSPILGEASLLPISVDESCRGSPSPPRSQRRQGGESAGDGGADSISHAYQNQASLSLMRERREGRRVQKQNMGRPDGGPTNSSNIEYVMASRVWAVRK